MAKRARGTVSRGAVVSIVHPRGGFKHQRVIVVGAGARDSYSRGYGRQVLICDLKHGASISEVGAGDAIVRGRVKKMPKACRIALAKYRKDG